ncbi:MAG: hypothetical protein LC745_05410, partial [Planctomycetia bacterium]|nr:hypothetical protein [Planctomycetia bacterium]
MTPPRRLAGLLVLALSLAPADSRGADPVSKIPDDVFARAPADDAADVVLFGAARAAVVRVHIKVGAKAYRTSWGDFAVRLHAYLDRNDDGVLTTDEANRAPWTNLLQNPFNGSQAIRPGARPTAVDASPKDGKVSYEELVAYLQRTQNFEPLNAEAGPPPDPRAEAVFGQFDRDGDKALSPLEISETDGLVARLDHDEDETLSLDEFTPDRSPLADRFGRVNQNRNAADPSTSPALLLTTPEAIAVVASRLLTRYGDPGKPRIRPEPLGASPSAFAAADADADGRLDLTELKR